MPQDLPNFEIEDFLPYRLSVVAEDLMRGLARDLRSRFGISSTEWRVLTHVAYSEIVSVRDVERTVRLEKSKVSRAASRLEKAGYLTKEVDDSDRRLLRMTLTERGHKMMQDIVPVVAAYQHRVEAALEDGVGDFQRALGRLLDHKSG